MKGVSVADVDVSVLDAFLRLAELLDKPEQIAVLAPMIIREIYYRMLIGPQGEFLRRFHTLGSQSMQIAQAARFGAQPQLMDGKSGDVHRRHRRAVPRKLARKLSRAAACVAHMRAWAEQVRQMTRERAVKIAVAVGVAHEANHFGRPFEHYIASPSGSRTGIFLPSTHTRSTHTRTP